jgi:hypothetical protein
MDRAELLEDELSLKLSMTDADTSRSRSLMLEASLDIIGFVIYDVPSGPQ